MNTFSLTRYLYILDEVKLALMLSILDKKDESVFWALEIYYTFNETNYIFEILWQIYYDFFAILNPSFESYFLTKLKEHPISRNHSRNEILVSKIVQDLLIRSYNLDAFLIRLLNNNITIKTNLIINKNEIINCIKNLDYTNLGNIIFKTNEDQLIYLYKLIIDILQINKDKKNLLIKQFEKIIKYNQGKIDCNHILLNKILTLLHINKNLDKEKVFYIKVKPEDIIIYNIEYNENPYKIMNLACLFKINDYKYFELFHLERYKYNYNDLKYLYHNNWLNFTFKSPVWSARIFHYNGSYDDIKQKIIFEDEDLEEEFYNKYNLEPDEQSLETKEKTIPYLTNNPNLLTSFIEHYNKKRCIYLNDSEILSLNQKQIIY